MPVFNPQIILLFLVRLMTIFLVNPLHEFAHAWTAYKLGDDTAKNEGRLTIAPLAHLDGLGALMLMLLGFGWAKPVPVSPSKFKHPSFGMMVTAVAGPLMNLLAALIAMVVIRLCGGMQYIEITRDVIPVIGIYSGEGTLYFLNYMMYWFIVINLNLFLFNMIPVPPLDGSRVLTFLLPPKAAMWVMRNQRVFYGIMMLLLFTGILSWPLGILNNLIFTGMADLTQFIPAVV
ncbi:MAG: site-2 protease family protein [Oscillospiraceae bacterium]|nr:site-2 protease family protein [Oscillospiraceae bacterium]